MAWGNTPDIMDTALISDMGKEYYYDENTKEWIRDEDYVSEAEEAFREHIAKLGSVGIVYSKTDRILTGDNVEVEVRDMPDIDTTAMNDGKTIVFNASLIEDITDESIVSLHGFNYHEVAHILYTPRDGSDLLGYVNEHNLRRAFNVLEDSRIERLITTKYPATRLFLEASSLDYLLKGDPKEWADYFILTTGRMYLPYDVRQELANRFIAKWGVRVAEDIHSITHAYRGLVFPDDFDKAKELITRMAEYLGKDEVPPIFKNPKGGHGERSPQKKGRPEGKKEQERLQDKANTQEKGEKSEEFNPQDNTDDSTDLPNSPSEVDTDFDNKELSDADKAMKDKIQSLIDEVIKDDDVKRDTREITKAITDNDSSRSALKKATYSNLPISSRVRYTAKGFATMLERLRTDNDPMWERQQSSGRLNVGRAMNYDINDINTLFDQWNEGNDATDIEAVICVDTSGSMGWQIAQTLESAWIIKRGIETINGRVAVYKFNHDSRLVYASDEKATATNYRYVNSSGGTNPYKSLVEAERILENSNKAIKILFIVTDGAWDNSEKCNAIIKRMGTKGVMTSVCYLGDLERWKSYEFSNEAEREQYYEYYKQNLKEYRHEAQFFRQVSEPKDLVAVASDLVKARMSRRK
jgi:hypothetical protein